MNKSNQPPVREFFINQLQELSTITFWLKKNLSFPTLILLEGTLGSGKTAFAKNFLSSYGIPENRVKSPTFSLINRYQIEKLKFAHLDLYRLEKPDPFLLEEIKEILSDQSTIVLIEWSEKLDMSSLYDKASQVYLLNLTLLENNFRKVQIYVKKN